MPDEHLGLVDHARLDPVDLHSVHFKCVVGTHAKVAQLAIQTVMLSDSV